LNSSKLQNSEIQFFITTLIFSEIKNTSDRYLLQLLIDASEISIANPSLSSQEHVKSLSLKMGNLNDLSEADLSVLALALDIKREKEVEIWSGDFDIQNVCTYLNLNYYDPLKRSITEKRFFIWRCTACKAVYQKKKDHCPECGNITFRRIIKHRSSI
jgi:rRNA maturation endonuclease Nob1